MSLPPELEQCLNKHVQHIQRRMAPDGVFLYLSGAKLLNDDDHRQYNLTADIFNKNHAILKVVSRHGRRGFDAFLEALDTTQQTGIAERLRATLNEKYSNEVVVVAGIDTIKNGDGGKEIVSSSHDGSAALRASTSLGGSFMTMPPRPRASVSSPLNRSRSVSRMTPLTPPLSEDELEEHLNRLKSLLHKISNSHGDRFCQQEATDLLGEMEDAGDAMVDRIRQLSDENVEKERELRRAKYMVRGMETEITRLKTIRTPPLPIDQTPEANLATTSTSSADHAAGKAGKPNKSKLCAIL
ncbi:uncharacterized protein [Littorina saxatilis]|uniref:CARD domain-containing protein n=1 Tax=Littorina saxatilis TaxID=31220 RepID=A0AAN9B574_9CAEN